MKKFICFILLFIGFPYLNAQISLPRVFSDHMVLQRNIDIPIWGKAAANAEIVIELADNRISAIADSGGYWEVKLPPMSAGGPFSLSVSSAEKEQTGIKLNDILIGDVWLASGQSNMEWQVQQSDNASEEISSADFQDIRFFTVPHAKSLTPVFDLEGGSWEICDSQSVKTSSAVAYFFARKLHVDLDIPIGIMQSTWGGTPVEAWTSREMLLSSPSTESRVKDHDSLTTAHFIKDSLDLIRFWDIVYQVKNKADLTIPIPSLDDSEWPELHMPGTFKDWEIPVYEGMVWLRKSVEIDKEMAGRDLTINLGHPEMNYSLYFNGSEICKTIWNANPTHSYTIPAELVNEGNNLVSVRMAFLWGGGGFNPPESEIYITDGTHFISLAGNWKYKKDLEPAIPRIRYYHYFPAFVYNAMVNPIIPYGIKGFIWYQGEANDTAAVHYRTLFPNLIADWRIRWQQDYLPFLYVQLPNYEATKADPSTNNWAYLREAQDMTLNQPNTGMVCTIDLGEEDNIHPTNKQDVALRLALLAEKMVYGKEIIASGPRYKGFVVEGNQIRIHFTETGSGMLTKNNAALEGFTIAGKDEKFYRADARIEGNDIVVSSEKVDKPIAARYAWADNPICNLYNKEGFPAFPFRTDSW